MTCPQGAVSRCLWRSLDVAPVRFTDCPSPTIPYQLPLARWRDCCQARVALSAQRPDGVSSTAESAFCLLLLCEPIRPPAIAQRRDNQSVFVGIPRSCAGRRRKKRPRTPSDARGWGRKHPTEAGRLISLPAAREPIGASLGWPRLYVLPEPVAIYCSDRRKQQGHGRRDNGTPSACCNGPNQVGRMATGRSSSTSCTTPLHGPVEET
jgi:hypothetical protein